MMYVPANSAVVGTVKIKLDSDRENICKSFEVNDLIYNWSLIRVYCNKLHTPTSVLLISKLVKSTV